MFEENFSYFKIKGKFKVIIWLLCMNFIILFAWYHMIKNGKVTFGGEVIGVCLLVVFWLTAVFLFISKSDVVISDQGVSRVFFTIIWRTLSWSNIQRITRFSVYIGNGKTKIAYNIFPKEKMGFSFSPSGKISFVQEMECPDRFEALLNEYVLKYNIRIEVREELTGKYKTVNHL